MYSGANRRTTNWMFTRTPTGRSRCRCEQTFAGRCSASSPNPEGTGHLSRPRGARLMLTQHGLHSGYLVAFVAPGLFTAVSRRRPHPLRRERHAYACPLLPQDTGPAAGRAVASSPCSGSTSTRSPRSRPRGLVACRGMAKITFIGAGSTVFARNLLGDILGHEELADSEITLFDIDAERLATSELVARRVADDARCAGEDRGHHRPPRRARRRRLSRST